MAAIRSAQRPQSQSPGLRRNVSPCEPVSNGSRVQPPARPGPLQARLIDKKGSCIPRGHSPLPYYSPALLASQQGRRTIGGEGPAEDPDVTRLTRSEEHTS